ncbi:enhancer of mRNA-decapping protein 4 isoform X2 [Manduca sexta]|uniref:enhancer of mRNA-decapping protein 4 isoform X2 n=1 Tax=Manduca sexta TaxID=7130 RepID=UPI0018906848|nr:enhancer of mRNA-decapping protein 4 isoform X2 [Manduca sexta]
MQPTTMLPKLSDTPQTISFSEGDGVCNAEVFSSYVTVTTNAGNHDHGSSKVKLKNLVDYNWEPKFYSGQLLAMHMSGKYLAYSIKAVNAVNPGTCSGMVRVVYNVEPGTDRRALIKGMKGEVQDLSFAHIQNQVVLACIDEQGNFYVHEIESTDSGLRCTLVAEVREDTGVVGAAHRVVWCPYIPDEDDDAPDDDVARLLLTTHCNVGRMWNMRLIASAVAGSGGVGGARALAGGPGALAATDHSAALVDAAFSPDGTALATASADGYVMFFQVYMHNESSPRCLHKWQPHGGKPLSCLFFLDNHKNYNSDVQFWKFAVTGAENNTTIKIWSCKSWNCVQTITFTPSVGAESSLGLKAMLDTSASYLLLSDFNTRSLYVLNMARDTDDSTAYCRSISEFLLPFPVLSLCIIEAEEQQVKCDSSCDDPFHRNGSGGDVADSPDDFEMHHDEEGSGGSCSSDNGRRVCVRLYIVQPKGLQEGRLVYTPPRTHRDLLHGLSDLALEDKSSEAAPTAITSSILQQQSQQLKNLLMRSQTQPGSLIGTRPESPSMAPQLNLMTPDAFSSPGKRDEDDPPLSATPDVGGKPRTSIGDAGSVCEAASAGVSAGQAKLTSGGSSPSREVQQILARDDPNAFFDQLEEESPPTPPAPSASSVVPNGAEPLLVADLFPPPENPPHPHKLTHANSDTSWPQISIAQITEANQRKASSDKSSSQSLNNSLGLAERACSEEVRAAAAPANARLDMLEQKLDKLTEMVAAQSRELRSLRGAVTSPRELIDEALHAHTQRTTQAIENALALGWERISRAGETASARAAAAAGAGAARALEPLAAALQHELAAKLSATDQLLRDNIDKLVNSKTVMERLSTTIAKSLSEMVRESFRSALFESVLPAMEKAHAQIFKQINQAFQNGTKEFAANTEAAARAAVERGGAAATEALRGALQRHADALQAARAHPTQLALLTTALRDATHTVLEKELAWWREQARTVVAQMSRAHSPASSHHPDRQEVGCVQMQVAQIQSLMAAGEVNGAFQQALSASDLTLVMCACRAAEPAQVFGPPCKLKQPVLLSLVQQLAADITTDTHLKHRYLEEAVMNLDTTSPGTREHLPGVVRALQKQIISFLQTAPSHALARQFRMLLMATEALVKSTA